MTRGKRSDPKKLERERKAIERDIARRTPTDKARSKGPGFVSRVVEETKKKINIRRQRRAGYGYPPRVSGALQVGHKKPASDA